AIAAAAAAANQEIHTLFISGLPDDVKAREIHNLFRRRAGFDTCLLEYTGRGNQVVAFATFFNHQSALSAMTELNGVIFDPETGATLHIELARSNSRRRPRVDGAYDIIDKRAKVRNDEQNIWSNNGNGGSDADTEIENSSKKGATQRKRKADDARSAQNVSFQHRVLDLVKRKAIFSSKCTFIKNVIIIVGIVVRPSICSRKSKLQDGISPCSTLFIANLSPLCSEEDIKKMLSECRGFEVLKMQNKSGKPVAFANFSGIEEATEAKEKLLGSLQAAADDAGLHLEYARSKMRRT
ncbi:uncharacterized protein LOC109836430, partial [Asparagus officinalis]|uniref:uncharacterized protein LOC109836430 n=1 Tax=Asparagus officinalis TaxID=4686 RepID=UPI00098E6AB9